LASWKYKKACWFAFSYTIKFIRNISTNIKLIK